MSLRGLAKLGSQWQRIFVRECVLGVYLYAKAAFSVRRPWRKARELKQAEFDVSKTESRDKVEPLNLRHAFRLCP